MRERERDREKAGKRICFGIWHKPTYRKPVPHLSPPQEDSVYLDGLFHAPMESYKVTWKHARCCDQGCCWRLYGSLFFYYSFWVTLAANWSPRSRAHTKAKQNFHSVCKSATEINSDVSHSWCVDVDTNDGVLQSSHPSCAHGEWGQTKCKLKLTSRQAYFGSTVSSIPQHKSPSARP